MSTVDTYHRGRGLRRFSRRSIFVALVMALLASGATIAGAANPPTVSVVTPYTGAVLEGDALIKGTTQAGTYPVRYVTLSVDGADPVKVSGARDWYTYLPTSAYPDGDHTLYIRAV